VFPHFLVPRHRLFHRAPVVISLAATAVVSALACEDEKALTAPPSVEAQSPGVTAPMGGDVTAMGTIPLPINQTFSGGLAFGITQTGRGRAGMFRISNTSSTSSALDALTNGSGPALNVITAGTGRAGFFQINNGNNGHRALEASTTGDGIAGYFVIHSARSRNAALFASTSGSGPAGLFQSRGSPILAIASGDSPLADPGSAASRFIATTDSRTAALYASNSGDGVAGLFRIQSGTSGFSAIEASTIGSGWAGDFQGRTKGVRIQTQSGTGLSVLGGSKQAVVPTTTGARALYSEEATEVWFADYGFGKLENGRARILIDPGFAQTVSLDEPYHVFVQPYGDAELYVKQRSNLGFVVMARAGDPSVEFGYRVVAKRSGFESQRLERAPWADNSSGF
jgi:hypothetical protein